LIRHGNPCEPPEKAWKFRLPARFVPFAWRKDPALLEASAKKGFSMIPRYAREQMVSIWAPETKFRIWFEIEAHATDALAELGVVPKHAAAKVWEKGRDAKFDVARIDEIEREVKHDVIAFLTHLAEIVGPEARFVHQGMTSSDVLDTCLNVQLMRAADLLIADTDALLAALKTRAFEYKTTPTIGRSHGIHAEPTTFGVKLATYFAEFTRARQRLVTARAEIATCAISGAVGTFANIDPKVEEHVARKMGLSVEPVSTQVIPRDRHAAYFAALGVVASSLERLAIEIRHLQRTEVLEAEEYFSPGQKGSSAMPHKRNPVLTENVTGLARMVRSYAMPAMENVALWHERDISHSSVERYIGPDATITLDFALARMTGVVQKLVVYPDRMQENLDRTRGLVHSQRVMLALTQAGVSREDSYRMVQRNAMRAWNGDGNLLDLLKADPDVAKALPAAKLEAMFDLGYHLKQVDTIFGRVFGS
jgi:adenylosuccinate lyase